MNLAPGIGSCLTEPKMSLAKWNKWEEDIKYSDIECCKTDAFDKELQTFSQVDSCYILETRCYHKVESLEEWLLGFSPRTIALG